MASEIPRNTPYPVRWTMDQRESPLRHLRADQRVQTMCFLGTMGTLIICLSLGAWLHYAALPVGHTLVAFGTVITGLTFHFATTARRVRQVASRDSR